MCSGPFREGSEGDHTRGTRPDRGSSGCSSILIEIVADKFQLYQSNLMGHTIDLGPNWIHGTVRNPILELANELKQTTLSPPEDAARSVYDELGDMVKAETAIKYSELVWGIIADAFKYSNEHHNSIPPEKSLLDFFESEVKDKGLDEASSKLVFQMAHIWGDFVGEPIEKQSLRFFWLEECIEGGKCLTSVGNSQYFPNTHVFQENLFLASTYKDVLNAIAKAALARTELHLSTKVTSITSILEHTSERAVVVTTASGTNLAFDEVIMTAPLGWLKHNMSCFTPALPLPIIKAIENISYGRLEKVYLSFPTAFWLAQNPAETSFFTQFLSPTYTNQNPEHWSIECVSLASLPEPCAHATLLFYVNGPCAQHVTSLVKGLEPTSKKYFSHLNDFFAPYYSRLPNYDPFSSDCKPAGILGTDWQNDQFAGWGSYTTFQTSQSNEIQLDKDIEALREGCPDMGLWFAGEHTAPFVALGTVTGAYWSGEAVAERIVEAYGMGGKLKEKEDQNGSLED